LPLFAWKDWGNQNSSRDKIVTGSFWAELVVVEPENYDRRVRGPAKCNIRKIGSTVARFSLRKQISTTTKAHAQVAQAGFKAKRMLPKCQASHH
jgi:hypothetical protein